MATAPREATPLLCAIGWHRPERFARWNHGYYFTRCARCRCDLVRTAYGRWHRPRGYRVVWQIRGNADTMSAALVRDPYAGGPPNGAELPIQAVIRHVQNGDRAGTVPGGAAGSLDRDKGSHDSLDDLDAVAAKALPARAIGDFMNEATGDSAWESAPRNYALRAPPEPAAEEADEVDLPDRHPGSASRLHEWLAGMRTDDSALSDDEPDPETGRRGRSLLALAAPIAIALLAFAAWAGWETGRNMRAEAAPARQQARAAATASLSAFVSADMVNCRSAPAQGAALIEVLRRGDPVRLTARDGDWVGLAGASGPCWTPARYVSLEPPVQDGQTDETPG